MIKTTAIMIKICSVDTSSINFAFLFIMIIKEYDYKNVLMTDLILYYFFPLKQQ